jgi:hypothetical protein
MKRVLPLASALALALLAACEHARPFGTAAGEPDVPYSAAFPRQLTFSPGVDARPAWLPDGSAFVYSYELPQPDHDRCLGILPAEGGHLAGSICPVPSPFDADSTNVLTEPAVGPGGRLAYLRTAALLGRLAPNSSELVVATLGAPSPGAVVLTLPYTAPDAELHSTLGYLRWLDAQTLVYLAEDAIFNVLRGDTTIVPLEIVRLDVSTSPAGITVLPGTAGATSVAVDSGGALYYTLGGDSRVYRYVAGAAPDTVYDFGAAGAAGDVQVRGNTLVALAGGTLYRVDLGTKAVTAFATPGSMTVSRPALSPSGQRVVAEASAAGTLPDLWLFQVP